MSQVLLVGLDGATFDIIRPLVDEGRLQNLARILEQGASGGLQSSMPPITPTAWTTVSTEKYPGKHGIYNFQDIDSATYVVTLPQHNFERSHEIMGAWAEITAGRRKVLRHFMQEVEWDLFFFVFSITDHLAHAFWTYIETTHPKYRKEEASEYRKAFYHA